MPFDLIIFPQFIRVFTDIDEDGGDDDDGDDDNDDDEEYSVSKCISTGMENENNIPSSISKLIIQIKNIFLNY